MGHSGYSSDTCKICGKKLSRNHKSDLCLIHYREFINNEKIKKWLETGDTGCQVQSNLKGCIRNYIYKEQHNKCAICGIENVWQGKKLNFVLDHIDGDASNSQRENLRLICPNCDSQLDTYKSKNKNSARKHRKSSPIVVTPIYQIDKDTNEIIQLFDSVKDAANKIKGTESSIRKVLNGYNKTAYGFVWKYAVLK